jgi:hypothetical protein
MQNEVQDIYWYNFQVSILVHITYMQNQLYDPSDASTWILKEIHYYLSDDEQHNTLFDSIAFVYTGNICRIKSSSQSATLTGPVVAVVNSRMQKLGTLYHAIHR